MKLISESKTTLNKVTYSLQKVREGESEGSVFIIDEPGRAKDEVFFPYQALKALMLLAQPNLKPKTV